MEDGHKHKPTIEEKRKDVEDGDVEKNVYSESGREELIEKDDEITDVDEGFMKGYDEGGKMAKCPVCNEILEDDFVERDIDGETHRFCSDEHAEKFIKKHDGKTEELEVGKVEKQIEEESGLEDKEKD